MSATQPDPPGLVRAFDWPASRDPHEETFGDVVGPADREGST